MEATGIFVVGTPVKQEEHPRSSCSATKSEIIKSQQAVMVSWHLEDPGSNLQSAIEACWVIFLSLTSLTGLL